MEHSASSANRAMVVDELRMSYSRTVLPKSTPPTQPTPTPPTASADKPPATDYPLFGMPSLVIDSVEIPDLNKKYIMWAKVTDSRH